MVDPITGAISIGAGLAGKEAAKATGGLLSRVLGPSADELGEALRSYTAFRVANVNRIATKAEQKQEGAGTVPPRVAHRLLEEGSFSDDELMAEYLSGVLAGSRSPDGRDDRAIVWSELVAGMSSLQLRAHFLLYREWARLLQGRRDVQLSLDVGRTQARLVVPLAPFLVLLAGDSDVDMGVALAHSIPGLVRLGLIGNNYHWGSSESSGISNPPFSNLLRVEPSSAGIELYGLALGLSDISPQTFAQLATPLEGVDGISDSIPGAILVDLPATN